MTESYAVTGYPSWQDNAILPARGYSLCPTGKKWFYFHIISPFLAKLVRSRWLNISLVLIFACLWTLKPSRSINTQKKRRTWPISSHLDFTLGQLTICLVRTNLNWGKWSSNLWNFESKNMFYLTDYHKHRWPCSKAADQWIW